MIIHILQQMVTRILKSLAYKMEVIELKSLLL